MWERDKDEWRVVKQDDFYLLLDGERAVYGPFKTAGHAYDYMYVLIDVRKRDAEGTRKKTKEES
jgi:hypothetical protein